MAKTPYGYKIIDGNAVIDNEEAGRLKYFFHLYMEGDSMAGAAKAAGIPGGQTAYTHLFDRIRRRV